VLTVGEEALAKSIGRLGEVDFFSVVTRKPRICDHKPVVIEVALARFKNRGTEEDQVQVLRFANRVPLQFDKAACAITKAIESVNWRAYGLNQAKDSVPSGPYVFALSVVSPFIKFKNASKETIDASDELVEEIRRALIQAGQKLGRHIRAEDRAEDLERKLRHLEQFGPMLVEGLIRILNAPASRKKKAEEGLVKILGRDTDVAEKKMVEAEDQLSKMKKRQVEQGVLADDELVSEEGISEVASDDSDDEATDSQKSKKTTKKAVVKAEAKSSTKTTAKAAPKSKNKSDTKPREKK
jgi:DNA topoisomerase-6 subunit B